MTGSAQPRRQMLVLGGSLHHPGGLEAFCERAASAVTAHASGWQARWLPTESAYFSPARLATVQAAWARAGDLGGVDLVWLQWSTLIDLLFLQRIRMRGVPVLVTPHLGAASRLQRSSLLRRISLRLLSRADRLALLFDGQNGEIALPPAVPRSTVGTFLPAEVLTAPSAQARGDRLRLIHAGRLSAEKGAFRMVELCAMLRGRNLPFTAQIVGSAEPAVLEALTAAIASADLGDRMEMSGWMDGPALRNALSRADVLVHLSELDSFPLIVLEALAAGTVPVVADMAGAASMVRRYGGLVTPGSSVAAAADWIVAQDLAALRRQALLAAGRVREELGWEHVVRRLEQAAEATLTPARRSSVRS
jgi:glycosyltransferase involved in cell wall biosynthesis